jgi:glucokinase
VTADGRRLRVGIDLGGTKCLGLALDGDRVVGETRWPTPKGGDALVEELAHMVSELERTASADAPQRWSVGSVGVGAPGLVDRRGLLEVAPNLPGVARLPLRTELEGRLGVPVAVDNDVTVAAWGEHRAGAARGRDDVVMVTLGTGIGGGIVAGGRLCRGSNGFAGEVGHVVVDPEGPPCPCGRRGCWERFASGSGLARLGREAAEAGRAAGVVALAGGDPGAVRGEHVTRALASGDADAKELMARFSWWVALGLANLANIFDPEAFVIGGGLVDVGDALFIPVRQAFEGMVLAGGAGTPVEIVPAALGERAGAMGAALLF